MIQIVLVMYGLMLAFIFWLLASMVERISDIDNRIADMRETHEVLAARINEKLEQSEKEMLEVRNDIGKLKSRISKLEKEI